jgi:5-methyltetrahydrofolate--homocysteine methyltransferase
VSKLTDRELLIFDGACGSSIQRMDIPAEAWGDYDGCNEWLNLSAPDAIERMHREFLDAGAHVIETNTFGAAPAVLGEYDLQDRAAEINHAAVRIARQAADQYEGRFVAGSVGPGTKLPSLQQIGVDELAASQAVQIEALVQAGVDLILFETCQDLLQVKTALVTAREVFEKLGTAVPLSVSVTVETTGTMLVGSDIAAAVSALEPFGLFSLGLNCATGPEGMASYIRYLAENWSGRISLIPNAGMPQVVDGKTVYPLSPGDFAAAVREYVAQRGVSVVGGCCGTTPDHIAALSEALSGVTPADREPNPSPTISSLYSAVEVRQEIPPLMIGERANTNGSKKFRELLLADDFQACLKVGLDQVAQGAHAVDLCCAYAGRDELADMTAMTRLFAKNVTVPTVIDSTTPDVIAACLRIHPGRCVVNSINLEDGGDNLDRIAPTARKYGAAVVALTINEVGMAMTAEDKLNTARAIHDRAVDRHGLRPSDLLFDPLTFTIASGDESLRTAGIETLEGIRRIKAELPGVHTVVGLSNISFGLKPHARRVLNSVFLHEAVQAGLDAAIVDAAKILPLASIDEEDRRVAMDLIYDRQHDPDKTPLMALIEHFADRADTGDAEEADQPRLPEEQLTRKVVAGDKEGLDDLLHILLQRHSATGIINEILVPAMRHVGELFGRGDMLLPFVLQAAEVMKKSVDLLEPYMEHAEEDHGAKVLLATVAGDVHDIGKNLVDIILTNNGYKVFNIGTKVPAERIIEKAREHDVDVIGLSGLLVKSAIIMKESMPRFAEAGLTQPILLGGAALTRKFVAEDCVPDYSGKVVYCADAFAGLKAMGEYDDDTLAATEYDAVEAVTPNKPGRKNVTIDHEETAVPQTPFLGTRHVTDIDPTDIFPYVNEQALFRGRWGYRRGKMDAEEYKQLVATEVRPKYEELCRRTVDEGLLTPKVAYGYFQCSSRENSVVVSHEGDELEFEFPRQGDPPHLCIADFYRPAEMGGDVCGFFVVTVGERIAQVTRELFEGDEYTQYMLTHAFSVEVTDALAEYWHEVMRREMGIAGEAPDDVLGYAAQQYTGSRYGFGYPACPDLDAHKMVFRLLEPEKIGVTLTESMEMVPEQSTSAIIAHHPQAKYFAV